MNKEVNNEGVLVRLLEGEAISFNPEIENQICDEHTGIYVNHKKRIMCAFLWEKRGDKAYLWEIFLKIGGE